jgi:hypothetical protein
MIYFKASGKFSALQDCKAYITHVDSVRWQLAAKHSTAKLCCRHFFFHSFNGINGSKMLLDYQIDSQKSEFNFLLVLHNTILCRLRSEDAD